MARLVFGGSRLGRALGGALLGGALLGGALLGAALAPGWTDASAGCVDRPCAVVPTGTPLAAAARIGQAVRSAQVNSYRSALPISLRGANANASSFDAISMTLPAGGATVTTSDLAVALTLPPGLAAAGTRLDIQPAAPPDSATIGGVRAVRVDLTRPDGAAITQLGQSIGVTLRYTASDLARAGVAAGDLEIQYSSDGSTWTAAPTAVDAASGEARTSVSHLTTFALVGRRRPTGYALPTAVPTAAPTPTVATGPFFLEGRGVAISGTGPTNVQNVLNQTYSGSWYNYLPGSDGPPGRVQVLRTGRNELPTSQNATIQAVAAARRGSYWIIGNEPNVADQDWDSNLPGCELDRTDYDRTHYTHCLPANVANYVAAYKRYRSLVLAVDPTAKFVVGNTLNVTKTCGGCVGYPLGRDFIELFRAPANWPETGGVPPVDVWGFHAYRIDWYQTPMTNSDEPKAEIVSFRNYLDSIGQSGKPIWITEFGVIWGFENWCWAGSSPTNWDAQNNPLNPLTNDCRPGPGRYVFSRKVGDPQVYFPLAADSIDAMIGSLSGWLYQNRDALKIERWFIFTDYGSPDPYTGVFGGISLMDGSGPAAQVTRFGRTYASAR